MPEPSGAGATSAQAQGHRFGDAQQAVPDYAGKRHVHLAPLPGKCRRLQATAPARRGRWAVARIGRQALRRQRGRLALAARCCGHAQEGRRRNRTGGGGEAGELVRLDYRAPRLANAG